MPLSSELKAHYDAVLHDLESEKVEVQQQVGALQARLKELHTSILTLSKRLDPNTPLSPSSISSRPPNQKYSNISVRWAILDLLNDSPAMATAEIADTLLKSGIQTRATNFANNVSAVLTTTMKEEHQEVQQLPDGKWELTDKGKDAIEYIRTTSKFLGALHGRIRRPQRF